MACSDCKSFCGVAQVQPLVSRKRGRGGKNASKENEASLVVFTEKEEGVTCILQTEDAVTQGGEFAPGPLQSSTVPAEPRTGGHLSAPSFPSLCAQQHKATLRSVLPLVRGTGLESRQWSRQGLS